MPFRQQHAAQHWKMILGDIVLKIMIRKTKQYSFFLLTWYWCKLLSSLTHCVTKDHTICLLKSQFKRKHNSCVNNFLAGQNGNKGKHRHWGSVQAIWPIRGSTGIALLSHDHGTRRGWGVWGQRHAPAALYSRERPSTHCTGGWVGPRAGLDRCGKSRPHRDSIPRQSSP